MRIETLRIINFNGFADSTFSFHRQFNLLVGDNGSGKTSILDALAVAVGSWFLGLRGFERAPKIDQSEVRVVPHSYTDSASFEKQFPSRIECHASVMDESATWARELRREGGRTSAQDAKAIIEIALRTEQRVRAGEELTLPLICAYGTERLWFEKSHRTNRDRPKRVLSRLEGYRDCFNFTIQETELLDWIRDQTTAALPSRNEPAALRAVNNAILACVDRARSIYYDGRYKDLVVVIEHSGAQLFRNLSDGQRIMLTLIGDLARRAAVLNPHLGEHAVAQTPGAVMIDELDLHLHPTWQRRVIHDLKRSFPNVQFIVTSHSPQLIGEALPDEVIRLVDGQPFHPPRSFGIDSSRILEEVMHAPSRDSDVNDLLSKLFRAIDDESFDHARELLAQAESRLGSDDPEITRARMMIGFLEPAL